MTDNLSYGYAKPSVLKKTNTGESIFLSKYSEVEKQNNIPCFFWGHLNNPFIMAKCLITLHNVVKSSFNLSTAQLSFLKDPIATAGNEYLRFEGFSNCAGVYARVDFLPESLDGEFIANGTTNVDFNQGIITALGSIRQQEKVILSVGEKELGLHRNKESIVERKVPLPTKWINGLSSVQIYLSQSEKGFTFNKIQTQQLFRSIPKQNIKIDYYLVILGNSPRFTPIKSTYSICVGGLHRLRLLEPLIPYIDSLEVFTEKEGLATTWVLHLGAINFSLTLSRESFRGFSGEGAVLDYLTYDVELSWMELLDKYAYSNQHFNINKFAEEANINNTTNDQLAGRLTAMGLLGYDLDLSEFFYRRLPFKLSRILSLNPRLKGSQDLINNNMIDIISNNNGKIEARVKGSGVNHTVIIDGLQERCTCEWYVKYESNRGPCKHVLAVKQLSNNNL